MRDARSTAAPAPATLEHFAACVGIMSLNSDDHVSSKLEHEEAEALSQKERGQLVRLATAGHPWLQLADNGRDYTTELDVLSSLNTHSPHLNFVVFEVNGADDVVKFSKFGADLDDGYRMITMGRAGSMAQLQRGLEEEGIGADNKFFLLGPELPDISSTAARQARASANWASLCRLVHADVARWLGAPADHGSAGVRTLEAGVWCPLPETGFKGYDRGVQDSCRVFLRRLFGGAMCAEAKPELLLLSGMADGGAGCLGVSVDWSAFVSQEHEMRRKTSAAEETICGAVREICDRPTLEALDRKRNFVLLRDDIARFQRGIRVWSTQRYLDRQHSRSMRAKEVALWMQYKDGKHGEGELLTKYYDVLLTGCIPLYLMADLGALPELLGPIRDASGNMSFIVCPSIWNVNPNLHDHELHMHRDALQRYLAWVWSERSDGRASFLLELCDPLADVFGTLLRPEGPHSLAPFLDAYLRSFDDVLDVTVRSWLEDSSSTSPRFAAGFFCVFQCPNAYFVLDEAVLPADCTTAAFLVLHGGAKHDR